MKSHEEDTGCGDAARQQKIEPRQSGPARTAKPADGDRDGAIEDAKSSNTASSSYRDEGKIKILLKGIDSLYLSFQGELDPELNQELSEKKLLAQSRRAKDQLKAQHQVGNHLFEVADRGQRSGSGGGFAYILEDGAYRICLASAASRSLPLAYVKVSSACLAHRHPEEVFDEVSEIIASFGVVDSMTISRVDVFVDFQSDFEMESFRRESWVTRAGGFDTHARAGQFTGYSIGMGGPIGGRLYNKSIEIKKSNKDYFNELWRRSGMDERSVWRLEFEVNREVLSELGIYSAETLLDKLGGIWAYATQAWLRLATPQPNDSNRARWPTHSLWGSLSEVRWRLDDTPLLRRFSPTRTPSEARLLRFFVSYVLSYMALRNLATFDESASAMTLAARAQQEAHCNRYLEMEFEEWACVQAAVRAKRFNLPYGHVSEREEAEASPDQELGTLAYYRASRGE